MSQDHAVQTFLARHRRLWFLIPLLVLAFLILLVGFILPGLGRSSRGLKPFRPSPTPGELALDGQAAVVTFTDLNDSPDTYRNQRIRVTGSYLKLTPPTCQPTNGPVFQWSLVAEDLQLNATGFEALLRFMPDGTIIVVEGIWRQYAGPIGCGKEPPDGQVWYLAVERIVSPNPLPNFRATPQATAVPGTDAGQSSTPFPGSPLSTPTPTQPAVTFTPIGTPTPTVMGTAVLPGTPIFGTPGTVTPTAGPGTVYPSITPRISPTPTNFPPGFISPTPTSPSGAAPTPTLPGGATLPPLATSPPQPTSPGYPGATVTPTPTLTPNPY
ncbi:MAG: hypothetical protein IPG51_19630 [Chloroflexi bacterium]|nr:hypothetical protein [Chloroflexota bacterium]MBK8933781.1 hypothetical protein [Chloroflexota bacterium]